jgi:hypothetical protein
MYGVWADVSNLNIFSSLQSMLRLGSIILQKLGHFMPESQLFSITKQKLANENIPLTCESRNLEAIYGKVQGQFVTLPFCQFAN